MGRRYFLGKELTEGTNEFVDAPFSLKIIPDCGHWIEQEAPQEVNQIIDEICHITEYNAYLDIMIFGEHSIADKGSSRLLKYQQALK